jgi:hypothetical protein
MRVKRENFLGLLLAMLLGATIVGCGVTLDDDDSAADDDDDDDAGDDDDATPAPDPLAPVIGLFNLTNVVQSEGQSYVDFSGAFGSVAEYPTETLSLAAYLATFSYGADAPYWRLDLGAFPLPAEGESSFVDMLAYYPWVPAEQEWWDGGRRIGVGNYLSSRLDLDDLSAYQVDDPVSPGALGWTPSGALRWENEGGTPVVSWSQDEAVQLPPALTMTSPQPGAEVTTPAALPYTVEWQPGNDDSFVTVGLISDNDYAWIAHVPDTGSFTIPQTVLGDEFGATELELVLGRNQESILPHPQGNILVRAREERRARLRLLPDLILEPGYSEAGETLTLSLGWFTQDLSGGFTVDLGAGINVVAIQPDPSDIHRADVTIQVASGLSPESRDLTVTLPSGVSETLIGAFAILNLGPSDNCSSANAQLPLTPGSWISTTAGLTNDYGSGIGCVPWSLNGSDGVYRLDLEAGETLIASLDQGLNSDPALLLLSDCSNAQSTVACADNGLTGDSESLVYTASSAGSYYLVVDSWVGGSHTASSSAFQLDISVEADVITPDWIVPGTTRSFTLFGEVPWSSGILPADIDLGAGIGIDATAAGSQPNELDLLATANGGAEVGPRDISVDNGAGGTVSFDSGLWVSGWPPYDSCEEAVLAPGLTAGTALGYGVQTSSAFDLVSCLPYNSAGPDVLLPFDLTQGQFFSASVLSEEDTQLYVLSDCTNPESCFDEAISDSGLNFEEESIESWQVPTTGRYYLVVDIWGSVTDPLNPWLFDLQVSFN